MLQKIFDNSQRTIRLLIRHSKYYRPFKVNKNYPIISDKLKTIFQVTNKFLTQLDVEYWLAYGTLLGYYRDGKIIPGDRDIDFGVHERYYQQILQARNLLPPGFKLFDTSRYHFGPKLYVVHDGWEADLYFYKDENNYFQSYEKNKICYRQPFPKTYIYPLKEVDFLGKKTWIPQHTEALLKHTYHYLGEDAVQDRETGYWSQKSV
ncbi:MAG: LicD family protein [Oscillatoria sp. PMC 1068.18]|nr:LicD family protein [Oscillatoria sp. PMC 1068.18]